MTEETNIPEKLRALRRSRGLTVNELADKMEENYQKVSRIERGVSGLTLDYLLKVTNALEAPIQSVLQQSSPTSSPREGNQSDPSILNTIILEVEKNQKWLFPEGESNKKASFISKLFEISQKHPTMIEAESLTSILELCKTLL